MRFVLKLPLLAAGVAVCLTGSAATAAGHPASPTPAATGLVVGVTHTQTTFFGGDPDDPAAPPSARRAGQVLAQVGPLQAVPLMGWGLDNPEPSPGGYDWQGLDDRMALVRGTGGTPVITLCCAPDWMKGGKPGETDWDKLEVAPLPAHYQDFANLAAAVAHRYPDVKYFQVWNELKGFWDDQDNRWAYENYTTLYNNVYDAVKAVTPDAKIGGPYAPMGIRSDNTFSGKYNIHGSWGWLDDRPLDAVKYWNDHKHGGDFAVVDGGEALDDTGRSSTDAAVAAQPLAAATMWVAQTTGLPVWWAEFYVNGDNIARSAWPKRMTALLSALNTAGAKVAMLWAPECDTSSASTSEGPCLWTSTQDETNGGRATSYVPLITPYRGLPG
jgi:hypothetical protein